MPCSIMSQMTKPIFATVMAPLSVMTTKQFGSRTISVKTSAASPKLRALVRSQHFVERIDLGQVQGCQGFQAVFVTVVESSFVAGSFRRGHKSKFLQAKRRIESARVIANAPGFK